MQCRDVLFEPWSLGDALIAAATAREDPQRFALLCDERWVDLIRFGLPSDSGMIISGVHLPYTMRQSKQTQSRRKDSDISCKSSDVTRVFSIRGDIRDYRSARRLFPQATISQSGWYSFLARKSVLFDCPTSLGVLPVRNRYKAWATLTGTSFQAIQERYAIKNALTRTAVVHIGAQWRSKRYPYVETLVAQLRGLGVETSVVRGPGDPLMPDVLAECPEVSGLELMRCFRRAGVVIANDSGPMHLAAYLGCRTICIGGVSNLAEWLPPSVCAITSTDMPKGYRPMPNYMSDRSLSDWPIPEAIVNRVVSILDGQDLSGGRALTGG